MTESTERLAVELAINLGKVDTGVAHYNKWSVIFVGISNEMTTAADTMSRKERFCNTQQLL